MHRVVLAREQRIALVVGCLEVSFRSHRPRVARGDPVDEIGLSTIFAFGRCDNQASDPDANVGPVCFSLPPQRPAVLDWEPSASFEPNGEVRANGKLFLPVGRIELETTCRPEGAMFVRNGVGRDRPWPAFRPMRVQAGSRFAIDRIRVSSFHGYSGLGPQGRCVFIHPKGGNRFPGWYVRQGFQPDLGGLSALDKG